MMFSKDHSNFANITKVFHLQEDKTESVCCAVTIDLFSFFFDTN